MSDPFDDLDFFTKKSIATSILQVSPTSINNYIKDGSIYPPMHRKNPSDLNSRSYYTLADAMRISIIKHGSIVMSLINELLVDYPDSYTNEIINYSFKTVKNEIISGSEDPVYLKDYLYAAN